MLIKGLKPFPHKPFPFDRPLNAFNRSILDCFELKLAPYAPKNTYWRFAVLRGSFENTRAF